MYILQSNVASTCPEFAIKIPNQKNWSENICLRRDIVLPKYKTVIFVNGCFWHGHTGCKYFVWPKNNEEFWKQKIGRNMERDAEVHQLLKDMGWFVIDVWECELKKNNAPQTLENLVKQLKTRPDSAHKK